MTCHESPPPFGARPNDATTVAVSGAVDVCSAPDLAAALADPVIDRVILTAVTFIDAIGHETDALRRRKADCAHRWTEGAPCCPKDGPSSMFECSLRTAP
jgi:hypothetical protein